MDEKELQKLIAATGALAEMSVLFLKSAMNSGATFEEAMRLTAMFLNATLHGAPPNKKEIDISCLP